MRPPATTATLAEAEAELARVEADARRRREEGRRPRRGSQPRAVPEPTPTPSGQRSRAAADAAREATTPKPTVTSTTGLVAQSVVGGYHRSPAASASSAGAPPSGASPKREIENNRSPDEEGMPRCTRPSSEQQYLDDGRSARGKHLDGCGRRRAIVHGRRHHRLGRVAAAQSQRRAQEGPRTSKRARRPRTS